MAETYLYSQYIPMLGIFTRYGNVSHFSYFTFHVFSAMLYRYLAAPSVYFFNFK